MVHGTEGKPYSAAFVEERSWLGSTPKNWNIFRKTVASLRPSRRVEGFSSVVHMALHAMERFCITWRRKNDEAAGD
jgi:hypothetical protein